MHRHSGVPSVCRMNPFASRPGRLAVVLVALPLCLSACKSSASAGSSTPSASPTGGGASPTQSAAAVALAAPKHDLSSPCSFLSKDLAAETVSAAVGAPVQTKYMCTYTTAQSPQGRVFFSVYNETEPLPPVGTYPVFRVFSGFGGQAAVSTKNRSLVVVRDGHELTLRIFRSDGWQAAPAEIEAALLGYGKTIFGGA